MSYLVSRVREDILDHPRRDDSIHSFAGVGELVQVLPAGKDDERTDFMLRHMSACNHNLIHGAFVFLL